MRFLGIPGHQVKDVRNGSHFRRDVWLIREKRSVTLRIGGMVAMHRADGPLAHMAWHDQNTFFHQENEFPEIAVREEGPEIFELLVWDDAALGSLIETINNCLAGMIVEEPEPRHGGIINHHVIFLPFEA